MFVNRVAMIAGGEGKPLVLRTGNAEACEILVLLLPWRQFDSLVLDQLRPR